MNTPFPATYWVAPGKFLAGEHPAEITEAATTERLTALLEVGVRTFVNLTEEEERLQNYARQLRTLASEQKIDIAVTRIPITDRGIPSPRTVRCILDLIDSSIANQNPVFVHCFAGVGRTGTIVGCYLRRHGLASSSEVIAKITQLRCAMPGGAELSPHTPAQIDMVKSWPVRS